MSEWAGADSGYAPCVPGGHRHWGPYGAAGLLVTATLRGRVYVLLTLRSEHVQAGGTWSVPGGAIERGETARTAAIAETFEEVAGLPADIKITGAVESPCPLDCGWSYATFTASAGRYFRHLPAVSVAAGPDSWETDAVRWVRLEDAGRYELHPGFAASWPALAERITGRRAA